MAKPRANRALSSPARRTKGAGSGTALEKTALPVSASWVVMKRLTWGSFPDRANFVVCYMETQLRVGWVDGEARKCLSLNTLKGVDPAMNKRIIK